MMLNCYTDILILLMRSIINIFRLNMMFYFLNFCKLNKSEIGLWKSSLNGIQIPPTYLDFLIIQFIFSIGKHQLCFVACSKAFTCPGPLYRLQDSNNYCQINLFLNEVGGHIRGHGLQNHNPAWRRT